MHQNAGNEAVFVKFYGVLQRTPGRTFPRFASTGVIEKFLGLEHFTGDLKLLAMSSPKEQPVENDDECLTEILSTQQQAC
jgi:hypothetical protein